MGLIQINQIEPEMVLAEDLKDCKGRFLLSAGESLTVKQIKTFKMWGVIEASIEGIVAEDLQNNSISKIDPSIIEISEKKVHERFCCSNIDHPAIQRLYHLCLLQKANEMQRQKSLENTKFDDHSEKNVKTNDKPEVVPAKIDFNKFIYQNIKLSTLPAILIKINEAIANPKSSTTDIARAINKDINLSARLLRIANSAFYGFPSQIDSVSRAVLIIGTKQLSTLASGVTILDMFKDISCDIIDMKSFWKHSIACGVNAKIIANYKGIQNTERLFLAGLLHDIGRLILYSYAPDQSVYALMKAKCTNTMLNKIENDDLNFDHAKTGGLLLKHWKLPVLIEHAVMYHHNPQKSPYPLEASIVHLADIMANAMGIGSSGERFVSPLDSDTWECIGLSVNIMDLIIKQTYRQIEEIFKFFYSHEN